MRFPSVKNLADNTLHTIKRFPVEVLFALAGTIAATIHIELSSLNRTGENWCLRAMMTANLGLLLSLSVSLFSESQRITGVKKAALRAIAAVLGVSLIFMIDPGANESDIIRFLLFSLAFHLSVAYAGFTNKGHIQGFWQFNKTLFLRFLTGALYAAVLFLGLAAAIGAMNFLFNFKFEWDTFAVLWAWLVGMFSTIFFLGGVPADLKALDTDFSYPKGLKIFTQYVLIPLATVYVLILLAYEIKILVQWQLPKGLVSNLILGYAVFGILSLLLVYPIREQEENKWLKTFTRSFYFLLIPLLILLFIAVGTRVSRYGVTEMRYFLILLACWLLFITLYFLLAKKQNIKLIPISLSILTLLSIYGPQSAFSVSLYSQRSVLLRVFKRNHAYKDGRLIAVNSAKISKADGNQAAATLEYLISKHDLSSIQPYFTRDLSKVSDSLASKKPKYGDRINEYELRWAKLDWAKKELNLDSFSGNYRGDVEETAEPIPPAYSFERAGSDIYKTTGYDYLIELYGTVNDTTDISTGDLSIKKMAVEDGVYALQINGEVARFDIRKEIKSFIEPKNLQTLKPVSTNYEYRYILPDDKLVFSQETSHFKVTMKVTTLRINGGKTLDINFASVYFLVRKK